MPAFASFAALRELLAPRLVVWKNDGGARDLEDLPHEIVAGGEVPAVVEVVEGELRFSAPLAGGQKTGWFYDQTANRRLLRSFLKPGARVLDGVTGFHVSPCGDGAVGEPAEVGPGIRQPCHPEHSPHQVIIGHHLLDRVGRLGPQRLVPDHRGR